MSNNFFQCDRHRKMSKNMIKSYQTLAEVKEFEATERRRAISNIQYPILTLYELISVYPLQTTYPITIRPSTRR